MNLAMQIPSVLLHQSTWLQDYARNRYELATMQFCCWCFCDVGLEQTDLPLFIRRPPSLSLVTHKEQNLTQLPIHIKYTNEVHIFTLPGQRNYHVDPWHPVSTPCTRWQQAGSPKAWNAIPVHQQDGWHPHLSSWLEPSCPVSLMTVVMEYWNRKHLTDFTKFSLRGQTWTYPFS